MQHPSNDITKRLKRIEGQVKGISKMVDNQRDCEDILVQMKAAQAALRKTASLLMVEHMEHHVKEAIASGEGEDAVDKMSSALTQILDL